MPFPRSDPRGKLGDLVSAKSVAQRRVVSLGLIRPGVVCVRFCVKWVPYVAPRRLPRRDRRQPSFALGLGAFSDSQAIVRHLRNHSLLHCPPCLGARLAVVQEPIRTAIRLLRLRARTLGVVVNMDTARWPRSVPERGLRTTSECGPILPERGQLRSKSPGWGRMRAELSQMWVESGRSRARCGQTWGAPSADIGQPCSMLNQVCPISGRCGTTVAPGSTNAGRSGGDLGDVKWSSADIGQTWLGLAQIWATSGAVSTEIGANTSKHGLYSATLGSLPLLPPPAPVCCIVSFFPSSSFSSAVPPLLLPPLHPRGMRRRGRPMAGHKASRFPRIGLPHVAQEIAEAHAFQVQEARRGTQPPPHARSLALSL